MNRTAQLTVVGRHIGTPNMCWIKTHLDEVEEEAQFKAIWLLDRDSFTGWLHAIRSRLLVPLSTLAAANAFASKFFQSLNITRMREGIHSSCVRFCNTQRVADYYESNVVFFHLSFIRSESMCKHVALIYAGRIIAICIVLWYYTFEMKMRNERTNVRKKNTSAEAIASENKSHKTMNLSHSSVILFFQLTNICIAFV